MAHELGLSRERSALFSLSLRDIVDPFFQHLISINLLGFVEMSVESVQRPVRETVESQGKLKMSDGFQLSYRRWSLGDETERIVLGLPGGGWYSGQFRQMGARLPVEVPGTVLYAVDPRGFGNSVEEGFQKGDLSSFERLLQDIDEVAESVRKDNVGKKFYLFGHSGGSLAALRFAASHSDSVDGLILAAGGSA